MREILDELRRFFDCVVFDLLTEFSALCVLSGGEREEHRLGVYF